MLSLYEFYISILFMRLKRKTTSESNQFNCLKYILMDKCTKCRMNNYNQKTKEIKIGKKSKKLNILQQY